MKDDNNKKQNSNIPEINETDILMKQLDQLSITEDKSFDELFSFQKNKSNNNFQGSNDLIDNFYLNLQRQNSKDNSKINSNYKENIEYNDKKELLKLKLDNILSSLRLSEFKINIKYYNSLLRFNDYFEDNILLSNYYGQFNDLFNIIIELLFIIKKENEKNESKNKNYKNANVIKLEREINNKQRQIDDLLDKLKIEKLKNLQNNSNELAILRKENNELFHQINIYKKQIKKLDDNNIILEEKLRSLINEKLKSNKRSSSVSNRVISASNSSSKTVNMNINTNNLNFEYSPSSSTVNSKINNSNSESISNTTINIDYKTYNNNDIIQNIKKLNIKLIEILKELNKILGVYDGLLNKNNGGGQTSIISNFNNMNILKDYDKIDSLYKTFLSNRDKILVKIVRVIENNEINQRKSNTYNYKKDNKQVKAYIDDSLDNKILVNRNLNKFK